MEINVGDIFIPKDESVKHMRIKIIAIPSDDFYSFQYLHFDWRGWKNGYQIRDNYTKEKQKSLFE